MILDIKTQILKIKWPEQGSLADLPNFESLARKYRFRLLGRACRDLGVNSLLLAHHEDDQAETILMRLALGQGANGLTGMKNPAGIPECYGIHGVHESGGYDGEHRGNSTSSPYSLPGSNSPSQRQLPIETGGIQVYRPFLHFTKSRLIATCLAENIEWFEDHTNKEPTTTMRNAVRHMYSNHLMPAALSKPALLALSERLNDTAARRSHIVQSWLTKCKITRFETSTGIVNVQFTNLNDSWEPENARPSMGACWIAAHMLREIIMLVTHREHVELSSLHSAVQQIFPEICQHGGGIRQPIAFTASGVYFQPVPTTLRERETPNFIYEKPVWILSRQPYTPNSLAGIQIDVRAIGNSWSQWYFYDGRYWIRVQNLGTSPLLLKPFNREQLAEFRAALDRVDDERAAELRLRWQLKNKAPGKVRYTLPAILKSEGGKETIIALPSLDLSIPGCMVRWEIRYKKITSQTLENKVSKLP
jgi:tRNA(Ile)-lysidine synthase